VGENRRRTDWWEELEAHRKDAYAHQPMVSRLAQENLTLRERFENRLNDVEDEIALLKTFRGQVVLLGAIGYLVLGVVLAGLLQRVFHISI